MNFWKKYFGDKNFYKLILAVTLPIMIQNGVTNFVNLLDNVMVGQVGTEQMSGVAIVNQLVFVFNLCIFGMVSGAGIFTSQFYGKKDEEGVRQTFRFKLLICVLLAVLAIGILILFRKELISLYLNDGSREGDLVATLGYAEEYLWIMLIGLVPYTISQVYGSTLRETEKTVLPMVAGFVAVIVNCIGNYILIFGSFGAPCLGVKGAAIATVVSRFIELAVLIIAVWVRRDKYPFIVGAFRHLFRIDSKLVKSIVRKGLPLFINETMWAAGVSALAQCYSTRGLAVVAAYNIAGTVFNVFNISYIALGNAVGIIIGKYLGAGEFDRAVDEDRKMITFGVLIGLVMGGILFAVSQYIPEIYNTTEEVKEIACSLLRVAACLMVVQSFMHCCYFTLRSGGKTIITFIYDSGFICLVSFPLALILSRFTHLDILPLYAICTGIDVLKCIVGYVFLKKRIWLNKIV